MPNKRKQRQRMWGWGFIIAGLLTFLFSAAFMYLYIQTKAALVEEGGENFWETLGLVYATAAIGSYYLLVALVAGGIGIILIFIGIVILRR